MKLTFGYGCREEVVEIPEENLMDVLTANEMNHSHFGSEAVRHALEHPIGAPCLRELVEQDDRVAIIVSDISRPVPSYQLLPAILDELFLAGCKSEQITVVFALGSHRKHTEAEMRHLVGDKVFETVLCVQSTHTVDLILMICYNQNNR